MYLLFYLVYYLVILFCNSLCIYFICLVAYWSVWLFIYFTESDNISNHLFCYNLVVYLVVWLLGCAFVYIIVCICIYLPICLLAQVSVLLAAYLCIWSSGCLGAHPSVLQPAYLVTCQSGRQSVCLQIYLHWLRSIALMLISLAGEWPAAC